MTSRFGLVRAATRRLTAAVRGATRQAPGRTSSRPPTPSAHIASDYPGDFIGMPPLHYAPKPDGKPDPGEIVWGWVPFEEDHRQGKDRPVLLVGRDDRWLLGLMLTSKDHDRDAEQERRAGRLWCDIGIGDWDPHHRASEVRVNRVLRLSESTIRREGSVLPRHQFDLVAGAVRAAYE